MNVFLSSRAAVPTGAQGSQAGLTLLEVMVALVILGLVATGFLQTYAGALHATGHAREWAQAVIYAVEGQEAIRIEGLPSARGSDKPLGGGFTRRTAARPWAKGVTQVTVTLTLPGGSRFELHRLVANP